MKYYLDSLHKRNGSIVTVGNTNKMETVDTKTAKVVDVKDIPFLRDYCIKKYQKN